MGLDVPKLSKLPAGLEPHYLRRESPCARSRLAAFKGSSSVCEASIGAVINWKVRECLSRRLIHRDREGRPLFSKHYELWSNQILG
jgi:hypothetical protein